ncbi:MAG TPA: ComF family protein, partial [Desulfomonilaceae bacterium]|nr:ComF family protein [Desulfomonilaceae bacterium]
ARARFGVYHDGMLRDALVRFKYQGDLYTGRALSELFVQAFYRHFSGEQFHVLIPVPIHVKRLTNRGFNQSLILAQRLSDATGIPVSRSGLRKITDTPPQVGLKRSERISNLKGSFGVFRPADVRGRRILLVDDVATTGSTIAECARTIRAAKAGRVDVLVLALRTAAGREIVTDSFARNGNDRV